MRHFNALRLVSGVGLSYYACTTWDPMEQASKSNNALKRTTSRTRTKTITPARQSARRGHGLSLLEDIGTLIARSHDLQETLEEITQTIAERMGTEVCSLYLYDAKERRLTLWATTGLDRAAVGNVTMSIDEGLSGLVIEKMEPVAVTDAMTHPRNKYFPETGEERFHSFLGLPILEKNNPLGVLVIQSRNRRHFSRTEIRLLKAISTQVSHNIVQARLLETLKSKEQEREEAHRGMVDAIKRLRVYEREREEENSARNHGGRTRLSGIGASPGFGIGHVHLIHPNIQFDALTERTVDTPEEELQRLHAAVRHSQAEIEALKTQVHARLPEIDVAIFDAHAMMLEDPGFLGKIEELIRDNDAAEIAVKKVSEEYIETLERAENQLLRERTTDIRDVSQRLLRQLLGLEEQERPINDSVILLADELTLSDLCMVDPERLKGVVLGSGSATSHASILAKSFEIPTVVGVEHAEMVQENDMVIVDGNSGVVYVNPGNEVLREYTQLDREYRAFNRDLEGIHDLPAETRDGVRVTLAANVGLLVDATLAQRHGAEGVGLYRTEIPFLTYRDFPSEEEQFELYRRVLSSMNGKPVTIRTLDLGPDKYPAYMRLPREHNPYLGWRSIRISLEKADIFKVQLRAILRVGVHGPVRLLLPMISSVEEIFQVKKLLAEVKAELHEEGIAFDPWMPLGVMVEVPAAVWLADRLIKEVDFFNIGTNDLIQYLLAVDRDNRKVASLYEPLHPAVLQAISWTVQAAKRAGRPVSMCGEMAADPLCTMVLLGMGLDELSMEPFFVPVIKRVVRSLSYAEAQQLTKEVLRMETVQEVKGRLFGELKKLGMIELVEMYH
ncbi:MAG: phosphoenolpyruvate--protein phosphotransferase [Deltaproteobacteria bacterium]|nr:phosphoenolpyruvate--protein phosphotransferase [Deltaproteobacteria bacterium]